MTDFLLTIIRILLSSVFAVSGVTKIADLSGTRAAIRGFGIPFPSLMAILVPITEALIAILLIPIATYTWGAAGVMILTMVFSAVMVGLLLKGRKPDCHCFGKLYSTPIGRHALVRNAVLFFLASLLILQGPGWSLRELPARVSPMHLAVVAMTVLGSSLVLHRLRISEPSTIARLVAQPHGVSTKGEHHAGPRSARSTSGVDGSTLIVFIDPDCPACTALLPSIAQWQEQDRSILFLLVSFGTEERTRPHLIEHGIRGAVFDPDRQLQRLLQVRATPSAVLAEPSLLGGENLVSGMRDISVLIGSFSSGPVQAKG